MKLNSILYQVVETRYGWSSEASFNTVTEFFSTFNSPSDNSVMYGDGKFKNAYGSVRLSGAVNMSALETAGKIVFDCVFVINI